MREMRMNVYKCHSIFIFMHVPSLL